MKKQQEDKRMNLESTLKNLSSEKLAQKAKQPGFWREMWQQARLVYHLIRDPEVPFYLKVLPFLSVVYLVIPVDFLPDILIGLGQLDDITVMLVGAKIFMELVPQDVVARHLKTIRQEDGYGTEEEVSKSIIIGGEYEVKEKDQA